MFLTKNLSSQIFDYMIDPWGEILSLIAWAGRASHHTTLDKTPAQLVFGRDMIFNLSTVIDWRAITLHKQKQVDRDNLRENARRITHDYAEQDTVYVNPDGINQNWTIARKNLYNHTNIYKQHCPNSTRQRQCKNKHWTP